MKQYEVVIEAMRKNGGYATLGWLYKTVPTIAGAEWRTKTPFASIRRIVQDGRFFFRIRPGLWALIEARNFISLETDARKSPEAAGQSDHAYYQGLLLEIGNFRQFQTCVPVQDKNHKFLEKPLGALARVEACYAFTYDDLVRRARTIDVIWFNDRKLPDTFFEVEHSTDIQNSLLKYVDLQDFNVNFRVVAARGRRREFESKLKFAAFRPIKDRVKFLSYDAVAEMHAKTAALTTAQQGW